MFLGSRARPVTRKCGILDVSQTCSPPQYVTGIALVYFTLIEITPNTHLLIGL
jgi:hypothetical protein